MKSNKSVGVVTHTHTHTHTHTNRKEKGITLIALIITVILLLILAGVAINFALGENGILRSAEYAVDKYQNTQKDEEDKLSYYEKLINETTRENSINIYEDLDVIISDISSVGCDILVNNSFDDAVYIYILDNKIQYYGNKNEKYTIDTLDGNKDYEITVYVVENNKKIHKYEKYIKTKDRIYLLDNGKPTELAGSFSVQGYVGSNHGGTLIPQDNFLRLNLPNNKVAVFCREDNILDFSKYKKIYVQLQESGSYYSHVFISTMSNYNNIDNRTGNLGVGTDELYKGNYFIKLDINDISDLGYLYIRQTWSGYADIYNIWFEE